MKVYKGPGQYHGGSINAIAVHDKFLVSCGDDDTVNVWLYEQFTSVMFVQEQSELKPLRAIQLPESQCLKQLGFLGNSLIVANNSGIVYQIFNYESPAFRVEVLHTHKGGYNALFVHNEYLYLAPCSGNIVVLHAGNKYELDIATEVYAFTLDPTGTLLVAIGKDKSLYSYQIQTGELFLYKKLVNMAQCCQLNASVGYEISFNPQGSLVTVVNTNKLIGGTIGQETGLALATREMKHEGTVFGHKVDCHLALFSPQLYSSKDGLYNVLLTVGEDKTVSGWATNKDKPLFTAVDFHSSQINGVVWGFDALSIVYGCADGRFIIGKFDIGELGQIATPEALQQEKLKIKPFDSIPVPKKEEMNETPVEKVVEVAKVESNTGKKQDSVSITHGTQMEFNPPSHTVPRDLKRKPPSEDAPVKKQKKELDHMDFANTTFMNRSLAFSKLRLATPKVRMNFDFERDGVVLEVKNGTGNEQTPTKITLMLKTDDQSEVAREKPLFSDFIPKFISMATGGSNFWAVSSEDGVLFVYSDSGCRVVPPIKLGCPLAFLVAQKEYIMAVTCVGEVYVWNMSLKKIVFPKTNLYPILDPSLRFSDDVLTRAENITLCALTSSGVPIVTLTNGDGYFYDKDMETWCLVSDSWWSFGSQYWSSSQDQGKTGALMNAALANNKSIVNMMERKTNDELVRKGRNKTLQKLAKVILMKEGFESLEHVVTLAHLENRMMVSLKLEENKEFKDLLLVYAIRVSEMGMKERLTDLLDWLYHGDTLAGYKSRDLLQDVIVACSGIRNVQRILADFSLQ